MPYEIYPGFETAKEYAADGRYDIMPISCELLSDICTPIGAVKILKNVSDHCYLLESSEDREKWGRWSFLGYEPAFDRPATTTGSPSADER